jgi:hypothetical protein
MVANQGSRRRAGFFLRYEQKKATEPRVSSRSRAKAEGGGVKRVLEMQETAGWTVAEV